MEWNRIWAIGRDTYLRLYPNPGFGVRIGTRRWSWGLRSGWRSFQLNTDGHWMMR